MTRSRFLVCEKTGRWAGALRRELADRPLRIYETRSLAECRRELDASPASFVALEFTRATAAKAAMWIEQIAREFAEVRTVVLGPRDAQEFELWMREAGAIHAAFSLRRLGPVARLASRHVAATPQRELSLREQIELRMPWPLRTPSTRD